MAAIPVFVTLRNADGPMAGVTVHLAASRGAGVDTITAPSPRTDGNGVYRAYLSSRTPGRTELAVTNLRAIFPETIAVAFAPPPPAGPGYDTGAGDAGDTSFGSLTIEAPPGAFDTFVRYVVRAGAADTAAYARANAHALAGAPAVALLPENAYGAQTYEIHAQRRSDSAPLDTGLLRPVRLNFAIPVGLAAFDRAALVIMLLDERDEDHDGVTGEWLPLPTTVDVARGVAWTEVAHFSVYRLAAQAVTVASLNDLVVYPNPWRRDRHAGNANPGVKLLLPVGRTFELSIHTLTGELVERVALNTAGGLASYGYCWDLTNAHGVRVASGVYLIVVRDTQSGETTVRKVAIID